MESRQVLKLGGNWEEIRGSFRWQVPRRYSIAERCCDSWAESEPDRVAIIHIGTDGSRGIWTYGQLQRASNGLAGSLWACGIEPGDRVAVLLSQSPEVLITHLAAYKTGAVVLPLFSQFGPEALSYRLSDSGARAIVTDGERLPVIAELRHDLPELREIYCVDAAAAPIRDFWAEIETPSSFTSIETSAGDPAVLIYTSGTTGNPKGVLHAHRFLIGHLPAMEAYHQGFGATGDLGWTPADWAWIGGLMDMAIPCLHYGVPLISHRMRKFDPESAYHLIQRERVTRLFLPPTALKLMRQLSPPGAHPVRSVFSGGEALGADLLAWGNDVLHVPINEGYGQTECNLVLGSCAGLMEVKPGSMGQAIPGHEVAVIDADGHRVPEGAIGEIAVRRPDPVMFLEYWNNPEQTAGKFTGDWMRTGDLGRCDGDGYFWFISRDDDVITSAGYRIGPVEIETCLAEHPDVVMSAVVGVPDPVRTEVVKAFVVLRDDAEWEGLEQALIMRVRDRIGSYLAPRSVERVDSLPMTASGKVRRRDLRRRV